MASLHLHEIERMLSRRGWALARIRGSHRHYRNAYGQRLTLAAHGGCHHVFNWRQLAQIEQDMARLARERGALAVQREGSAA